MTRIALVHDGVNGRAPGEEMLELLAELFPRAELRALYYIPGRVRPHITTLRRKVSGLSRLRAFERRLRWFAPVLPLAMRRLPLEDVDLAIATGSRLSLHVGPLAKAGTTSGFAKLALLSDAGPFPEKEVSGWAILGPAQLGTFVPPLFGPGGVEIVFGAPRPGRNWVCIARSQASVEVLTQALEQRGEYAWVLGRGKSNSRLEFLGEISDSAFSDVLSKSRGLIQVEPDRWGYQALWAWSAGLPALLWKESTPFDASMGQAPLGGLWDPSDSQTLVALMERSKEFDQTAVQARKDFAQGFSRDRFKAAVLKAVEEALPHHD